MISKSPYYVNGEVKEEDNILGFKVAYLDKPLELSFTSLKGTQYSYVDFAKCLNYKQDKANTSISSTCREKPEYFCTCGFYSYKNFEHAYKEYISRPGTFLLTVANFGKIIEHEFGYRSEIQEVKYLHYREFCSKYICNKKTFGLALHTSSYGELCEKHYNCGKNQNFKDKITLDDLQQLIMLEAIDNNFLLSK